MNNTILKYFVALSLSLAAPNIHAYCSVWISGPWTPINFNWTTSSQIIPYTISIDRSTNSNNGCRKFKLGLSAGQSAQFTNRKMYNAPSHISYNLYKNNSPSDLIKDAPTNNPDTDTLDLEFPNNSSATTLSKTFYAYMPAPPNIGSIRYGYFQDSIVANLYRQGQVDTNHVITSTNIQVQINVPRQIDISLTSLGGSFDINQTSHILDFGTLTSGESQSMSMIVRSNAGYSIRFSSANNGVLKLTNGTSSIPYTLAVNGSVKDLSNSSYYGVTVAVGQSFSGQTGVSQTVGVTIGNIPTNVNFGTYQDIITIIATATE